MNTKHRRLFTKEIVPRILNCFGGIGFSLAEHYSAGRHKELINVTVNPKEFTDWREFFSSYCASVLVKKLPSLDTGIDTADVAIKKFLESEESCRRTNFTFARDTRIPVDCYQNLVAARRECRRILGSFSWDATLPYLSHGPGATFGTRREYGHPWYKFGEKKPTATGECLAIDACFLKYAQLWDVVRSRNGVDPKVVAGSKITTVPKDARTDRVIAIEPLLNMFYQKGIGGLMRSRLKRSGCDLNDQTINQQLARAGSQAGHLATLDLSSASDTICSALVDWLIPEDWLLALRSVRCNRTVLPSGESIFLQKFSSMGNGFTFELESCIFLALARVACRSVGLSDRECSVYGDDIVVAAAAVPTLEYLLQVCGFTVNLEKSFSEGPFRESCGKHYFHGHDVTPLYLKGEIDSEERLLWALNSIRRLAARFAGFGWGCDDKFLQVYDFVFNLLPRNIQRLSVPEGYGDGGVLRDFDEVCPSPRANKHWVEGYSTRHVVRQYSKFSIREDAALLYSLHALEKRVGPCYSGGESASVPKRHYRLRVATLSVPRWPSLGPWVSMQNACEAQ